MAVLGIQCHGIQVEVTQYFLSVEKKRSTQNPTPSSWLKSSLDIFKDVPTANDTHGCEGQDWGQGQDAHFNHSIQPTGSSSQ